MISQRMHGVDDFCPIRKEIHNHQGEWSRLSGQKKIINEMLGWM